MSNREHQEENKRLHIRNRNREKYDLEALIKALPELSNHVKPNIYGNDSVEFSNPIAVRLLNKSILHHYYDINIGISLMKISLLQFPEEQITFTI